MKQLYWLVFLGLVTFCAAQSNPEDDIPIFDFTDYYAVPKMTLSIGARVLTGSKTSFGGQGLLASTQSIGDFDGTGIVRQYHDGTISKDARTDASGTIIDVGDGKTNSWTMVDARQVVNDGSDIAFHTYSAATTDTSLRSKDPGPSMGTELVVTRDMGKIGKHMEWKFFAGVSMSGIHSSLRDSVSAIVTTVTDTYTLDGQTPPSSLPYVAPTSTTIDGVVTDTSILIGQKPDSRTTTTSAGTVDNYWKVKGTYLTLRMGPTLIYSFSNSFRLSLSAGPTLSYAGTTYTVAQALTPDTSDPINSTVSDTDGASLTGYYVDATMQYLINDRSGLYAGAFYQASGDYNQAITENGSTYTTNIDLSQLQGFRAGLTFKF